MLTAQRFEFIATSKNLLKGAHPWCLHRIIIADVFSDEFKKKADEELRSRSLPTGKD
jgi:hypothetical protein